MNAHWVIKNKEIFDGAPIIKGTRIPVWLVLRCLAEQMTADEIAKDYPGFPKDCITEVLEYASQQIESMDNDATLRS